MSDGIQNTEYALPPKRCLEPGCCNEGHNCDETGVCHNDEWHREVARNDSSGA